MQDKMFLQKASEGGMAEVQLGQLAAQKGNSAEVKQFGQKMVEDHTRLNEQMKPIADTLGVNAPKHLNKVDQAEYDKLSSLSGDAFDTPSTSPIWSRTIARTCMSFVWRRLRRSRTPL